MPCLSLRMSRRVALVLVLLGIVARGASAAAPVRVSLVRPVPPAVAGQAWIAKLAARPRSFRGTVEVAASGARRLTAAASRSGSSYRARFVFPQPGRWTLTARAGGSTSRLGSIQVRTAPRTPIVLSEPTSIDLEPGGTLLVVENSPGRLLRVDPATGTILVLAPSLVRPYAVARAPSGTIFLSGSNLLRRQQHHTGGLLARPLSRKSPVSCARSAEATAHRRRTDCPFRLRRGRRRDAGDTTGCPPGLYNGNRCLTRAAAPATCGAAAEVPANPLVPQVEKAP